MNNLEKNQQPILQPETPQKMDAPQFDSKKNEQEKIEKDSTSNFLREQGFNGDPKIKYSINVLTAKNSKGENLTEQKIFTNYEDLQNFIKNNSDILVEKKLMEETGIVPFKIDYDQSVYDWSNNLSKEQNQKLTEAFDKFSNETMDVKNFKKVGENSKEYEEKINQIKNQILSSFNDNPELSPVAENQTNKKEKEFKVEIPHGWTTLKHGTNLLNWGEINPYTSDKIKLEKPLLVISQEDFEQDQQAGKQYDTTKNYATITQKPEGMTDKEFVEQNKQFEIRILFYQDHIRHNTDSEYKQKLDKKTLDEIAKYYFANIQNGRHPLVPKGEILTKLGQTQENGKDVFYFVPENLSNIYQKEESETKTKEPQEINVKKEKVNPFNKAFSSKELIDALNIPTKEYTERKGVSAIAEVFKMLYPDSNQLMDRLENMLNDYRIIMETSVKNNPQKPLEAHQAFSNKKIVEKLSPQERQAIENFLNNNYKKMGGQGQRMISTEYVFSHFINFIEKINSQNIISKEDFKKFIEKNEVSEKIIQYIAKKIINGEEMSKEEMSIYSHKSNDIEKIIQIETKK